MNVPEAPFFSLPPSDRIFVSRWAKGRAGRTLPASPPPDGFLDISGDRHSSCVGNPFAAPSPRARIAACEAFDGLLKYLLCAHADLVYTLSSLSAAPDSFYYALPSSSSDSVLPSGLIDAEFLSSVVDESARDEIDRIAEIHSAVIHAGGRDHFSGPALVAWLTHVAAGLRAGRRFRVLCWCRDDLCCRDGGHLGKRCQRCHCSSLVRAAVWLEPLLDSIAPPSPPPISELQPSALGAPPASTGLLCGDWPLSDIFACYPPRQAAELASFSWPLRSEAEVDRLLTSERAAPTDLIGFEFSAANRLPRQRDGVLALSVDTRESLTPGMHACVDMRIILCRDYRWQDALLFPPCTHQVLSDRNRGSYIAKRLDGRTFFGICLVHLCWCVNARRVLVEQPDTIIPDYSLRPTQRLLPSHVGDDDSKPINFYTRGRAPIRLISLRVGASHHGRYEDFANAEERDRHRSSWLRFPRLVQAVRDAPDAIEEPRPCYRRITEAFAIQWAEHFPLPHDYANEDAQPTSVEARAYQFARGAGDGRRFDGIEPHSLCERRLRRRLLGRSFSSDIAGDGQWTWQPFPHSAASVLLVFVAMLQVPLVLAATDGVRVLGASFEGPRSSVVELASRWAARVSNGLVASAFLAGELEGGRRLVVAPLPHIPPGDLLARQPNERRRLALRGIAFAWLALAALAGCPSQFLSSLAVTTLSALRSPIARLQDRLPALAGGHFASGAFAAQSIANPALDIARESLTFSAAERRDTFYSRLLVRALRHAAGDDPDLHFWADQVQPPPLAEVPEGLLGEAPLFDDDRLDALPFSALAPIPELPWWPRLPLQPPPPRDFCPHSPRELLLPQTRVKVDRWMQRTLADLVCIRDLGTRCERTARPSAIAIGQSELVLAARGLVWDFTHRDERGCARPLAYDMSVNHTLNVDYLLQRLRSFPNQRLVSMLAGGARFLADVELQTVLVPHLTSLPLGFESVGKELRRLNAMQPEPWYDFFENLPYWPFYANGQGATARKLEPDRFRRTTEGGGPRRPTFDAAGLAAWSLNDAARAWHLPAHFASDTRPEMLAYLRLRGFFDGERPATSVPAPAPESVCGEIPFAAAAAASKIPKQVMPSPSMVMRDLSILKRAGRLLGEPVYLFGDDVKDYFNHFPIAPEDLWKSGVIFLGADGDLSSAPAYHDSDGNHLIFVSEKRLGFGTVYNSNHAQQFSEALNFMLREDMDRIEDPLLEADPRSTAQRWLASRREVERIHGGHQRRLYMVHMYCDDNIMAVVGVDRAVRLLRAWRRLTKESGLIMAIPQKRSAGTWALWLGIYFLSTFALAVLPRAKVLRAAAALRETLTSGLDFGRYRSLVGLLEHVREVVRLPRRVMFSLYGPHSARGESRDGPAAIVHPHPFMREQLQAWLDRLASSVGAPFTRVLRRNSVRQEPSALSFLLSSDAATDSDPPGMGGFMHGFYWYLEIPREVLPWLHITTLEFLATGFGAMTFGPFLPPGARIILRTDALVTPHVLTRESQKSETLAFAHHRLLQAPAFAEVAMVAEVTHGFGETMALDDAVSRSLWPRFRALCAALRVRPTRLVLSDDCSRILSEVTAFAQSRGVMVRTVRLASGIMHYGQSHDRPASPEESARGRRHRSNTDGDGPSGPGAGAQPAAAAALPSASTGGTSAAAPDHDPEAPAAYTSTCVLLYGRSHRRHTDVILLIQNRFGRVEPISETREWAVDGSAAATAMRGIAEELLGVPATIIQGMCHSNLLLQRLDKSGVALRHLGRSPLSVHRSYCLRADHLFNGGVDEAVNRFKPNEEAMGVILVPLQYLSGASGETRVTDVDGHRWSLRGDRHLGERRVQVARDDLSQLGRAYRSNTDGDGPLTERKSVSEFVVEFHRAAAASRPAQPGQAPPLHSTGAGGRGVVVPSLHRRSPIPLAAQRPTSQAAPDRMPLQYLGGLLLPQAARKRPRPETARATAMDTLARRQATAILPASASLEQRGRASALATTHVRLAEFGAAWRSLDKEDAAWPFWAEFCDLLGLEPLLASSPPSTVVLLLSWFTIWVYPKLKGRRQPNAKPDTALGYALSIRRSFKRIRPMPKASALRTAIVGLMRQYKNVYGVAELAPRRKEPLTSAMWASVENLASGSSLRGSTVPWNPTVSHVDRTVLRIGRVFRKTGNRLGEAVANPADEESGYYRRSSAVLHSRGCPQPDASREQWQRAGSGDSILLVVPTSKTDQFGLVHCPFPCVIPYDASPSSAFQSIRDIELTEPCVGSARERRPLFATPEGEPYQGHVLRQRLHQLVTTLFGSSMADVISFHSFRIDLACRLLKVKCPWEVIQLILRKTTPESLRAYSRLGFSENASWTTKAATATYSATQVANFHALSDADPMKAFINGGFGEAPARSTPAPRGSSHSNVFAIGAKVLVPATVYPSYPCRENEGRGWTATVLQRSRDAVRLEFTSADSSGAAFEPVWLKSAVLIAVA